MYWTVEGESLIDNAFSSRYDLAEFNLDHLQKLLTLQSGGVSLLVYSGSLLLTLANTRMDDKLSLHQHNDTIFTIMEEEDLARELETWKILNLTRSIAVIIGWFIIALRPNTDLLVKHLAFLHKFSQKKLCQ